MRRARCSRQKIVDIFLYVYRADRSSFRGAGHFGDEKPRDARHSILRKSRTIVGLRFEKKKRKKRKRGKSTIILYFGVNVNESAHESSSAVRGGERVEWNLYIVL